MKRLSSLVVLVAMMLVFMALSVSAQQPKVDRVKFFGANIIEIYGDNLNNSKVLIDGVAVDFGPVFDKYGKSIAILAQLPPIVFGKHKIKITNDFGSIIIGKKFGIKLNDPPSLPFVVSDSLIFVQHATQFRIILPVIGSIADEVRFTNFPKTVSIHDATIEDMIAVKNTQTSDEYELTLVGVLKYIVVEGEIDTPGQYTVLFEFRDTFNIEVPFRVNFVSGSVADDGFLPVIKKLVYDKDTLSVKVKGATVAVGQLMIDATIQNTSAHPNISGAKLQSVIDLQPSPWIDEIRIIDPETLRFSEPAYLER